MTPQEKLKEIENSIGRIVDVNDWEWLIARVKQLECALFNCKPLRKNKSLPHSYIDHELKTHPRRK